jgi:coenzyme F420 hydrogenase subunit beta
MAKRDIGCGTVDGVVRADLCCGCGVCAGVCPRNLIEMRSDARGCRVPVGYESCESVCGVCEAACPFAQRHPDEDDLAAARFGTSEGDKGPLGMVRGCWAGYVRDEGARIKSSSGGLCTWLLSRLLSDGAVEAVACVVPRGGVGLFEYALLGDAESLEFARGSRYYPVDLALVVREIRRGEGKVAVVGLPCALKGVARAMASDRRLRERVVFLVGLACGQMKSAAFTEYLGMRRGLSGAPDQAEYRVKSDADPAGEFRFAFSRGNERAEMDWLGEPSSLWTTHWFTLRACHYCDDLFAEVADVSFMDAWLKPYDSDWKGTSLVAVRSSELTHYFADPQFDPERTCRPVSESETVSSQATGLADKRDGLAYRLARAARNGRAVPEKRVVADLAAGTPMRRLRWRAQERHAEASLAAWGARSGDERSARALAGLRLREAVLDTFQRVVRRLRP